MNPFLNKLTQIHYRYYQSKPIWVKGIYWLLFGFLLFLSIDRALEKGPGGDFYVFWLAGKHFLSGDPIYQLPNQPRNFLYPPFAAFLFSFLAIFPFKMAAIVQSLGNLLIWPLTFLLGVLILEKLHKSPVPQVVVLLTFVFTFNFYLVNHNLLQVNTLLLLLILSALYAYLIQKYWLSGALMGAAVLLKVTPVIFLAWYFIRGRLKAFLTALGFIGLFTLIPLLVRGIETGFNDLLQFWDTLKGQIPESKQVNAFTNNKSLRGMLLNFHYQFDWLKPGTGSLLMNWLPYLFGMAYLFWLGWLRIKRYPLGDLEFAATLLLILLVSEVTRNAHMVSLSFVLLTLFSRAYLSGNKPLMVGLVSIGLIFTITGRDIIGDTAFEFLLQQINLYTWALITLFILVIGLSVKSRVKGKQTNE